MWNFLNIDWKIIYLATVNCLQTKPAAGSSITCFLMSFKTKTLHIQLTTKFTMGNFQSLPGGYKIDYSDEIDRGAFGSVYKGCNQSRQKVAIKIHDQQKEQDTMPVMICFIS